MEIFLYDENNIRFDAKIVGFSYEYDAYEIEFRTGNDKKYPFPYVLHIPHPIHRRNINNNINNIQNYQYFIKYS